MSLYPQAAEETIRKIDELKPHIDDMRGRSGTFIQDQIERITKYGAATRWSPAQLKWINELHDEYVGSGDGPEAPELDFAPR